MSHISATIVAALFFGGMAAVPARADTPAASLTIRVYDGAALDPARRTEAIEMAAAIIADSGASATWHDCTGGVGARRCDPRRGAHELLIRIVPTGSSRQVLGFVSVEPSTGGGVLATIYLDRVRETADRARLRLAVLLGRVMAHEVGHLMPGANGHADHGLMREVWTAAELAVNDPDDWRFSRSDQRPESSAIEPGQTVDETGR